MSFPRDEDDISRLSELECENLLNELLGKMNIYLIRRDPGIGLQILISLLDEADNEDTFGTEGWRHALLGE